MTMLNKLRIGPKLLLAPMLVLLLLIATAGAAASSSRRSRVSMPAWRVLMSRASASSRGWAKLPLTHASSW